MSAHGKETYRHLRSFYQPWHRRPFFWLFAWLGLLIAARLALDPVATHYARKALAGLNEDGYEATFADVSVSGVLPLSYAIRGLTITEAAQRTEPFFRSDEVRFEVSWRPLLDKKVVASRVLLDHPTVMVAASADGARSGKASRRSLPEAAAAALNSIAPLRADRVEVRRGEVILVDPARAGAATARIHHVEGTLDNVVTRADLAGGQPVTAAATGTLQKSGDVRFSLSADPWKNGLTFTGRLEVGNLKLSDLYGLAQAASDPQNARATLDVLASFEVEDGDIAGGVKASTQDVRAPVDEAAVVQMKGALADKSLTIAQDAAPGQEPGSGIVPIRGKATDSQARLWPTAAAVMRNAFVEGLAFALAQIAAAPPPAPTEAELEGLVARP